MATFYSLIISKMHATVFCNNFYITLIFNSISKIYYVLRRYLHKLKLKKCFSYIRNYDN